VDVLEKDTSIICSQSFDFILENSELFNNSIFKKFFEDLSNKRFNFILFGDTTKKELEIKLCAIII
jgi:hypothetical protein